MAHQIWLNKKRRLGTQQNITQKESKEHNKMSQHFRNLFYFQLWYVSIWYFIILFFTFTIFSQKILDEKLLLVLKLCIKKKQTKRQHKKIVCETVNFGSPNLTILKKKSKNTIKYHSIFTIPSFLGFELIFYFILLERNATSKIFLEQISNNKLLLVLNWVYYWYHFFIHQKYLAI